MLGTSVQQMPEGFIRELLHARSQRKLDKDGMRREANKSRRQVVDGWNGEQVIAALIESAVESFKKQPFPEFPKYFEKRLEVPWAPKWREDLLLIVDTRNRAAHTLGFSGPPAEDLAADLDTLLAHGESIARAVAAKHGLPLRSA